MTHLHFKNLIHNISALLCCGSSTGTRADELWGGVRAGAGGFNDAPAVQQIHSQYISPVMQWKSPRLIGCGGSQSRHLNSYSNLVEGIRCF